VHMESFVATLCRPLPVTVRVRATVTDDAERRRLAADLTRSLGFTAVVAPEEGIYQLADNVAKADLSPEQRQWLVTANESGKIARQELGSMLPVRLLAALLARLSSSSSPPTTASIRIWDLCASPGSKTLQALEVFTKATIIANDINANRLTVLREAVQRSGLSNDVIGRIQYTNQDASTFKLYTATATASTAAKKNSASNCSSRNSSGAKPELAKFRLILCDVPCSGDGTCRKDPSILPQWKPTIGNQLHAVQLAILQRGLVLLKPGGYLCYSTCSMYPVENEAVVAAALMTFAQKKRIDRDDGAATAAVEEVVELVDCPTEATRGFRLAPGLRHWIVAGHDATVEDDTGMVFYESYQKALEHSSDLSTMSWLSSMWPPTSSISSSSNEEQVYIQLSRCRRLWPHHQNSGGFFVAMFHKMAKKKQTKPR
jgi:16S rRNA C967 or C1407 C5-methylase (RsmB/RsmF family)